VVCHPEFKATYQQIRNDVCLIEIAGPVTFTDKIKPVCVSTEPPEGMLLHESLLLTISSKNDGNAEFRKKSKK